jgi:hypothetical protein
MYLRRFDRPDSEAYETEFLLLVFPSMGDDGGVTFHTQPPNAQLFETLTQSIKAADYEIVITRISPQLCRNPFPVPVDVVINRMMAAPGLKYSDRAPPCMQRRSPQRIPAISRAYAREPVIVPAAAAEGNFSEIRDEIDGIIGDIRGETGEPRSPQAVEDRGRDGGDDDHGGDDDDDDDDSNYVQVVVRLPAHAKGQYAMLPDCDESVYESELDGDTFRTWIGWSRDSVWRASIAEDTSMRGPVTVGGEHAHENSRFILNMDSLFGGFILLNMEKLGIDRQTDMGPRVCVLGTDGKAAGAFCTIRSGSCRLAMDQLEQEVFQKLSYATLDTAYLGVRVDDASPVVECVKRARSDDTLCDLTISVSLKIAYRVVDNPPCCRQGSGDLDYVP